MSINLSRLVKFLSSLSTYDRRISSLTKLNLLSMREINLSSGRHKAPTNFLS